MIYDLWYTQDKVTERILVVDDESWVLQLVRGYLEQAGFAVVTASSGRGALAEFAGFRPDLVILDWMLPDLEGMEVASHIRRDSDVPIIMLTARSEESDRVLSLESGVDDYVVKPFSMRELEARVRAVLRRAGEGRGQPRFLRAGAIQLNLEEREVQLDGRPIQLTAMEFDLLAFFMQHPGRVFTRLELLETLRGSTYKSFERSIDSHVRRLRQRIESDPKTPRYVLTVFGVGYKFAREDPSG